eukprot:4368429-Pleurochrysis_carterae.AAC.1
MVVGVDGQDPKCNSCILLCDTGAAARKLNKRTDAARSTDRQPVVGVDRQVPKCASCILLGDT